MTNPEESTFGRPVAAAADILGGVFRSEARLVERAMRHGGVVTLSDLRGLGLTRRDVGALIRRGRLLRPAPRVFVPTAIREAAGRDPRRRHLLSAAVALAVRGRPADLVVSHASAALIHGLPVLGPAPVTVMLTRPPGTKERAGRDAQVYEADLPTRFAGDVFGVPVATAARTCVDLGRACGLPAGLAAADRAVRAGLCTRLDLADAADCFRGGPDAGVAAQVKEHADGRSGSVLRSLSRAVLLTADLPEPEFQPADLPAAFLWRRERVAAVTDENGAGHEHLDGYEVIRWGWADLRDGPDIVITRVRAAFARTRRLGHWR